MRVWLIDDDHVTNMLNRYYLEEHFDGLSIQLFGKAKTALEDLFESKNYPDVIFLDINMPEMNGWEFLDALLIQGKSGNHFPDIYMLSSSLDPADKLRAENNALVRGFISKPFEVENLRFLSTPITQERSAV